MPIDCIVLDFDGTFTDVEAEAAPFVPAYRSDVADVLGRDVTQAWEDATQEVLKNPNLYGWKHNEQIVAPALADPYILCTVLAHLVFERFQVLQDKEFRSSVLQLVYSRAYQLTHHHFRPYAAEVIEALLAKFPGRVFVVTNSNPDTVKKKLDELIPRLSERLQVEGNAKKFILDELAPSEDGYQSFAQLPIERKFESLRERPMLVRRGHYFRILQKLWKKIGASPQNTLVCGDIYELDLSLPEALGASVHLVTRPNTPAYERDAALSLGTRGALNEDLRSIIGRLR
jgi:FMN phosphatase YigB (HAD superfamily)